MISVIGAGPAGSYLAYLLAKNGEDVNVYEDHEKIGVPIQCTGITTMYLEDVIRVKKEFVINTITGTRVFGPSDEFVDIKLKKNFIVDRDRFDSYLASIAEGAGVKFFLGHRFLDCKVNGKIKMRLSKGIKETDILVGADGPFSSVAKSVGIYGNRKLVVGVQARVKLNEGCDRELVEFFLDRNYFGWLVPENEEIARVGIACEKNGKEFFDKLIERRNGKIIEWQSGMIPVYNPDLKTEFGNVFLVGDAAAQVKATTYGGIIPGMMAGEELCKAILERKDYEKLWKKRVGKELWMHLMIRRVMDRFSNEDYDYLIKLVSQERVSRLIGKHDREFPTSLVSKILLREPRFLKFLKNLKL